MSYCSALFRPWSENCASIEIICNLQHTKNCAFCGLIKLIYTQIPRNKLVPFNFFRQFNTDIIILFASEFLLYAITDHGKWSIKNSRAHFFMETNCITPLYKAATFSPILNCRFVYSNFYRPEATDLHLGVTLK